MSPLQTMSESKLLRLFITVGTNEEVIAILVRKQHSDLDEHITPPTMVEHEGEQYTLGRQWMPNVYVYIPSQRRQIDDFLGNEPL